MPDAATVTMPAGDTGGNGGSISIQEAGDSKQKFKTEGGIQYPRSSFAYTPTDNPSDWKLIIYTPAGAPDPDRLPGAAAALSAGGFRGRKAQIPVADMAAVKAKIRAAYKKWGKKPDEYPASIKESEELVAWLEGLTRLQEAGKRNSASDEAAIREIMSMAGTMKEHPGRDRIIALCKKLLGEMGGQMAGGQMGEAGAMKESTLPSEVDGEIRQSRFVESYGGELVEAVKDQPGTYEVTLIKAGLSKNRRRYQAPTLERRFGLFEGVKAYADHGERPRSVRDLVGWWDHVGYATATASEPARLTAHLHITEDNQWLAKKLDSAIAGGKRDLFGVSIDAEGPTRIVRESDGLTMDVLDISKVHSVDVVAEPAAGGEVHRKLAAGDDGGDDLTILSTLTVDELRRVRPDLVEEVREQVAATASSNTAPAPSEQGREETVSDTALQEVQVKLDKMQRATCAAWLNAELKESGLPEPVRAKVRKRFEGLVFEEVALREALQEEKDMLAKLSESGEVRGLGAPAPTPGLMPGLAPQDQIQAAMDRLFGLDLPDSLKSVPRLHGIREAYIKITGDLSDNVGGQINVKESILRETLLPTSFTYILGSTLNRRLVKDYQFLAEEWRKFCQVVSVNDFRQQELVRWGGLADLATVGTGTYQEFAEPTDEEATYTAETYGNLLTVHRRTILNDDVRLLTKIPGRIARAANRTLAKFVYAFISGNGNVYDGSALFVAGHSNLGAVALSSTSLMAGLTAMRKQAETGSSERIGLQAKYLLVPPDLDHTATILMNSTLLPGTANNDINPVKGRCEIIVVPYFTDTNNWYLVADPAAVDTLEVGFVGGQETPELLVQDSPTVGSVFTADKITYKVRHEYGAAVVDYRGFYGAVVA